MAIEINGESIEIVDAHVHMGGRPRREQFDAEKNSIAGRAYYYSYSGEQVVKAMDQSNVDTIVGFALGGFSSEYSPFQMKIEKLTKYPIPYTGWTAKELKMILGGNLRRILGAG